MTSFRLISILDFFSLAMRIVLKLSVLLIAVSFWGCNDDTTLAPDPNQNSQQLFISQSFAYSSTEILIEDTNLSILVTNSSNRVHWLKLKTADDAILDDEGWLIPAGSTITIDLTEFGDQLPLSLFCFLYDGAMTPRNVLLTPDF